MGRQQKQTAEYFPHFVGESKTIFILENRWGNDGYAFWFKLLELLCKTDGQAYDCSSAANREYLFALTKVSGKVAAEIIQCLVDLRKIDRELWENDRVIWVQNLVDNLEALYSKRVGGKPTKPNPRNDRPELEAEAEGTAEITEQESSIPEPESKDTEQESDDTPANSAEEETSPSAEKAPRQKKTERKKTGPKKIMYAEFVSMTYEEHKKLVDAYGPEMTARMIEVLDNYKGSRGKTYRNDYRAILNWVVARVKDEYRRDGDFSYGRFNSGGGDRQEPNFTPSTGFKRAEPDGDTE